MEEKKVNKNYKKESTIDKKVKNIFRLMEILVENKTIKANDKKIADELECSTKTLGRYLEDISTLYGNIVKVKQGKGNVYELTDISYIFQKIISTTDDLSWLIELIDRWDSSILGDLYDKTLSNEQDIFLYKNSPFEELQSDKEKEIFRHIKSAIKNRQLKDIYYKYDEQRVHQQAICLKLIFMEHNWYVAIVDHKSGFRFLRISFIEDIRHPAKSEYGLDEIEPYSDFFTTIQNPMTLFNKSKEKAYILASPKIAKYFKKDMKNFFDSQQFIQEYSNGSVEFTLEYTQPMEILPFIKKWLPNLKILSPKSLDDGLRADLETYLK